MASNQVRTWKGKWLDRWLALPFHWVLHLLLLAFVIACYWATHEWGCTKYLADTRPVLAAASQSLGITASGAELKLTFKGNKLEHAEAKSVLSTEFLGVGGTPAVLGLVHKHRTWVDQVNQRLAAVATTLLTHAPRDDWARSWQIPLDAISTRTEPRIVRPKDIRKTLSEGALTPNDYLRVIDAVLTGELSVRTKESPTVAVQPEDLASPRLSLVREALRSDQAGFAAARPERTTDRRHRDSVPDRQCH